MQDSHVKKNWYTFCMNLLHPLWLNFATKNNLSERQLEQFKQYYTLLIEANVLFNITAITDVESVIAYHFEDSIKVGNVIDITSITSICDIGTGGGFPGIPLKISYPHLKVLLLEVSQKKITFLEQVVSKLGLKDVETCDFDWRTFLRKTSEAPRKANRPFLCTGFSSSR